MKRRSSSSRAVVRALLVGAGVVSLAYLTACDDTASQDAGTQPSHSRATRDGAAADAGDGGDAGAASNASGGTHDAAITTRGDAGGGQALPGVIVADAGAECATAAGQLPSDLACTGLYTDIAKHTVAAELREYAPAHQLWSDGATKQRWIYLPDGTQIDSSKPDDWHFPVGTKLFKEFSWKGHRVETRLYWKSAEGRWLKASYHWNDDETSATRFAGGAVQVAGDTYHIPTPLECDTCHKGRNDRVLGFEMISLGLPEAKGLTLSKLIAEDLLTDKPQQQKLEIGDDGSGAAAPALAWMHVNCGISCHNSNSNSEGYKSDLYLRLSSDQLDGRSSADFDAIKLTVGVDAKTPRWRGQKRVVAGSHADSLLYTLVSKRDPVNMKDQMPPIASRIVDTDGIALVQAWIDSLPAK